MRTKRKIIKEQSEQIERLNRQLEQMRGENSELAGKVKFYLEREAAISKAFTEATTAAEKIRNDAQDEAEQIRAEAETYLRDAKRESDVIVDVAYQNARDIIKEANEHSRLRLEQTEAAIKSYGELLEQFNNAVKDNAVQAEANAKQYAEFYRQLNVAIPELIGEQQKLTELIDTEEQELPDAGEDPSQLMKNIYKIEQRNIPEIAIEEVNIVDNKTEDVAFEATVEETDSDTKEEDEGENSDNHVYTVDEIAPDVGTESIELDNLLDNMLKLDE